ncbi:MAG: polysaccharide biosynthesis protein [Christensenellaceae bacterium]|jgi:stage V sporulation protein B|nr:polysaccharide biosynthesis protein [Christensenellaceae bacterium]
MKNKNHRKSTSLFKSAGILTIAIFMARIIGAIHRLPLAHILGTTGMGLYQLVFPIYSFLLSTSSGALPVAISMIVGQRLSNNNKCYAREILNVAMSALLVTGLITAFTLIAMSGLIGKLQGATSTRLGYIAIAPAVFFTSGIAVLRGWFQGNGSMKPSALSQVTEAVIKLIAGLIFARCLLPFGIEYATAGALTGVTLAEGLTLLILYLIYRKDNPRIKLNLNFKKSKEKYKEIIKLTFPMTIGGMILPLSQMLDSLLVLNLTNKLSGSEMAVVDYGLYTGYVGALVNFPIMAALSLGIAVAPVLRKDIADHNISEIKKKINASLKITLMVTTPFTIYYCVAPDSILNILYPSLNDVEILKAISFLRIGGISVIGLSLTQVYASILQGLGKMYEPVKSMSVAVVFKIILSFVLASKIGIHGIVIATAVFFAVSALSNFFKVMKLTGFDVKTYKYSLLIVVFGLIISGGITGLIKNLNMEFLTLILMISSVIPFLISIIAIGTFTDEELINFPFGKLFLKFAKVTRIFKLKLKGYFKIENRKNIS